MDRKLIAAAVVALFLVALLAVLVIPGFMKPRVECGNEDVAGGMMAPCLEKAFGALENCNDSVLVFATSHYTLMYDISRTGEKCRITAAYSESETQKNDHTPGIAYSPQMANTNIECNIPSGAYSGVWTKGQLFPAPYFQGMENYCSGSMMDAYRQGKAERENAEAALTAEEKRRSESMPSDTVVFRSFKWGEYNSVNGASLDIELTTKTYNEPSFVFSYTLSLPGAEKIYYQSGIAGVGRFEPTSLNHVYLTGVPTNGSLEAELCYWYKNESNKQCTRKTLQSPKIGFEINPSNVAFDINASQLLPLQTKTEKQYVAVKNLGDVKIMIYSHGDKNHSGNHDLPFSYWDIDAHSTASIPVEAVVSGTECKNSTTVLEISTCQSDPNCPYKKEIVATTRCHGEFNQQNYEANLPADTVYIMDYWWEGKNMPLTWDLKSLKIFVVSKTDVFLNYTISIEDVPDSAIKYYGDVNENGKHYGVLGGNRTAYNQRQVLALTYPVGDSGAVLCFWRNDEATKQCKRTPLRLLN